MPYIIVYNDKRNYNGIVIRDLDAFYVKVREDDDIILPILLGSRGLRNYMSMGFHSQQWYLLRNPLVMGLLGHRWDNYPWEALWRVRIGGQGFLYPYVGWHRSTCSLNGPELPSPSLGLSSPQCYARTPNKNDSTLWDPFWPSCSFFQASEWYLDSLSLSGSISERR